MRILLVGQAAFAEEVLRGLEAAGDTIAAVVCPPDAGPKPDPVKAAALARGIPVHQFRSLRAPEARHAFAEARADLGVLAFFGEKDAYIPLDSVEQLQAEARRYGKAVEVVVYPGAEHGFFCNERASYQKAAAEDAWARLKKFFATHLKA